MRAIVELTVISSDDEVIVDARRNELLVLDLEDTEKCWASAAQQFERLVHGTSTRAAEQMASWLPVAAAAEDHSDPPEA